MASKNTWSIFLGISLGSFEDNLKNSLAHALLYISEFDTYYIENITYLPFVTVAEQGKFPLVLGI